MTAAPLEIDLSGLIVGQPQVWRAIRIVPLLRHTPIEDLRLDARCYDNETAWIDLPDRTSYVSFVPHAFVARWSTDGTPAPACGTQLATKHVDIHELGLRWDTKMARREAKRQLRFLPLHTAMEGYLALHFKGPPPDDFDYTKEARQYGLSPRIEQSIPASWIAGLEDAVRRFEIVDGQVGALYFVADALAAAFVLPHPDDYRQLHRSILMDFFGEQIHQFGCAYDAVGELVEPFDHERIHKLDDIRKELARVRDGFRDLLDTMTSGLTTQASHAERVYKMGRHTLHRFRPEFRPGTENHLGEIVRTDGQTAYLKTLRLSEAQTRRGYLLSRLAAHGWRLKDCAAEFGQTVRQLVLRLENAGFDGLVEYHAGRGVGQ